MMDLHTFIRVRVNAGEHKVLRLCELRFIHLMISKYLACNEQLIKMCAVAYKSLWIVKLKLRTNKSTLKKKWLSTFKVILTEQKNFIVLYLYIVDITIFESQGAFFCFINPFFLSNYHLQASLIHLSVECELSWYKCIKYTLATTGTKKRNV